MKVQSTLFKKRQYIKDKITRFKKVKYIKYTSFKLIIQVKSVTFTCT